VKDIGGAALTAKALDPVAGTRISVVLPLAGMAAWSERNPPDKR
jgi:hypothetical protein